MSESSEMKLLMLLALVCLCIGLSVAQESNSTCPYPGCSCEGTSLVCSHLTALPTLPIPNQFTEFFFDTCNFVTLSKLPSPYSNATDLVVTNCGLSSVANDAFELLGGLETLELMGNRLTTVSPISLSPLKNLVTLDLSYNRLKDLPDELFKGLPKLQEIDLGGNQMQFTENLFNGADALTKMSCNDCQLKVVPTSSLRKIKNLEHLELNENPFQSVQDNTFQGLQQIQNLSLDNCSLTAISKQALQHFLSLRLMNFGHNQLQSIPVETFRYSWNSLKKLYLESNLFTSLDENLAPWYTLEELKLVNNPWHCDCNLAWIKNISTNVFHKENVTCVSPSEFKGHSVQTVVSQLNCPSGKYLLMIGLGIPALVICVTLTISCLVRVCRRRRYKGTEVKYSQVYGETVSTFNSTQSLVT